MGNGAFTSRQAPDGSKIWRIDEPRVDQRVTRHPEVTLRPNDVIVIQAGGGVQTDITA